MRHALTLLCLCAAGLCTAQEEAGNDQASAAVSISQDTATVTIASRGLDVRSILFDLFSQAKKNFVLEPNVHFALYLALTGVQFDEALEIVCHTANLKYEVNNGIYFVSKKPALSAEKPRPTIPPKTLGRLSEAELQKRLTTRMAKTPIRQVLAEFGKQTSVTIEVDKRVPDYKVDAFLVDTSLKFALDVITRAAGLVYTKTDNRTIKVEPKSKV